MSKISIDLIWKLEKGDMSPGNYSNQHEITFTPNTKILAAHDVDVSSQPSGTSMKYKIETLNQSSGSKETNIGAVSFGWK